MEILLENLAPPDPNWLGTGALERPLDVRDWHMEAIPQIAATAPPPSYTYASAEEWPLLYFQNGYGACVDHSECTVKTAQDWKESGRAEIVTYDAMEAYFANGGRPDGSNGVLTSVSLARLREVGALDKATGRRRKISGYAFAPRQSDAFRETIASALASDKLVVIATLLPERFGRHSSGSPTSGYHQLTISSYDGLRDEDEFSGPNTWGKNWGELGFYGLTWGYVTQQNFLGQMTYAYVLLDEADYIPPPKPEPLPDPNYHLFDAIVLKALPNKLVLDPAVQLPNLKGRLVRGVGGGISFQGKVKRNDEDTMVIKGAFDVGLVGLTVQVETIV